MSRATLDLHELLQRLNCTNPLARVAYVPKEFKDGRDLQPLLEDDAWCADQAPRGHPLPLPKVRGWMGG